MKYFIFYLTLLSLYSCSDQKQEEKDSKIEEFLLSREEKAIDIQEQNFSAEPSASPVLEEERIKEETKRNKFSP